MQATYQTRIEGNDEALSAYAALYGRVQRRLFAGVFLPAGPPHPGPPHRLRAHIVQGIWNTGPDVQRGAGIPGGEGLGGAGVPTAARRDPEGPGPRGRQGVGWRGEEG